MKKWSVFSLFLAVYLCLCLLAACGAAGGGAAPENPAGGAADKGVQSADVTMVCRVISGGGTDTLLLAKQSGSSGDVYRLKWENGADGALRDGALVEIAFSGDILESFPAQLCQVSSLTVLEDGFDDRCALYFRVLNDLWTVDEGLNSDLTALGVDLSATGLSESERAAVAWAFSEAHGIVPVQGTFAELTEQGYITGEPLEGSDARFWQWTDGCLFSITEKPSEGTTSLNIVRFDAQKWRSGTGAYYFADCTAVQSADGAWDGYQVGSEAIS
ncbi:hypothetical protein [Oscillibacter sp.]|uniref:hypothetical protein n=1 Tax=Oscillibacter sp. TaxID=1945593 RepID=UPI00261C4217|nr:hypothetical protein [Oscillibacter sp.]MDD3347243.1 hypothetical protein [Oscillibacter sp.]